MMASSMLGDKKIDGRKVMELRVIYTQPDITGM